MKATGIILDQKNNEWKINLQDGTTINIIFTPEGNRLNKILITTEAMEDITTLLGGTINKS